MAKIIEVVKSASVRVNLGDYQSVDFFVSFKAQLNDKLEDLARAEDTLDLLIAGSMTRTLSAHFAARNKKLTARDIAKRYGLALHKPKKEDFP